MIEINLVPDVKQEYIKARRVRTLVISSAILVGLASVGIVVLLAVYLFFGQALRSNAADEDIKRKSNDLTQISDLDKTLTVQQQLSNISKLHNDTNVSSRFFDMLAAVNPQAPNNVTFSLARVESETGIVRLEGQAVNGYSAADVLKKTILGTSLSFKDDNGENVTVPLTKTVSMSELSFGEDASGKKVLRFTLTFEYDPAFLSRKSENMVILRPDRQNVTDSFLYLPESLFGERANNQGGAN